MMSEGAVGKYFKLRAVENRTCWPRCNIDKNSPDSQQGHVKRLNCTRQDSGGALWKPGIEAYVCNSHHKGFQGPSRTTLNTVLTLFKRPQQQHLSLQEVKRQRRLLEQPKLSSTVSDTSVEDHKSEECDTRLATLERHFRRRSSCRPRQHLRSM